MQKAKLWQLAPNCGPGPLFVGTPEWRKRALCAQEGGVSFSKCFHVVAPNPQLFHMIDCDVFGAGQAKMEKGKGKTPIDTKK